MPLHDHFRPPANKRVSWEGLLGAWTPFIAMRLNGVLPDECLGSSRVHLGDLVALDELTPSEFEVRVYDEVRGQRLVAAVELASPRNKDRPPRPRLRCTPSRASRSPPAAGWKRGNTR